MPFELSYICNHVIKMFSQQAHKLGRATDRAPASAEQGPLQLA